MSIKSLDVSRRHLQIARCEDSAHVFLFDRRIKTPMKNVNRTVFAIHIISLICIAVLIPSPGDSWIFLAIAMGVTCGQSAVLATWMVFGLRSVAIRVLESLGSLALIGTAFCFFVIRTNGPDEVCFFSCIALLVQWMLIQIPFWMTRATGWMVVMKNQPVNQSPMASQYHLWHLFAWTTGVAVLLGVGRMLSGVRLSGFDNYLGEFAVFFAFFAVGNVLLAGPLIWATLIRNGKFQWSILAAIAIGFLTYGEVQLFRSLTVAQKIGPYVAFVVVLNTTYLATVALALITASSNGWRFVHVTRTMIDGGEKSSRDNR